MNYKELAEKAREIKADGERFLAQYENEIVDFLREDAEDAESRLQKEIFFEFLDNLQDVYKRQVKTRVMIFFFILKSS